VVACVKDPNPLVAGKGFEKLEKAGIKVHVGLCAAQSQQLNEGFFTYHTSQRPFMISKWAMTLDGKIATEIGHSRWISNEKSRMRVHEIRSQVDAVMVGIGTVIADNPVLNIRLPGYSGRQPRRVVIDGHLRIPLRAKCLEETQPGQCVLATTEAASRERVEQLRKAGHKVLILRGRRGVIDLRVLIKELYKMQIQSVLCEGGSGLHGALLQARLVDKVVAFVAPKIIGGAASKTPVSGWGVHYMNQALMLEQVEMRMFDNDICLEGYLSPEQRRTTGIPSGALVGTLDQEQSTPTTALNP
jgi:diaminohydroxyphosphoribosylaminopyrimidine deaminase/5-amino-6-(5-phosphoribosylamino)uracil reductase